MCKLYYHLSLWITDSHELNATPESLGAKFIL